MANDSPLRVLHLTTDLGKGGAQRFVVDLATVLQKRDDVEVVIGSLFDINDFAYETSGLAIRQLGFRPFSLRGDNDCPAYSELLTQFRPDVIHTHRFLAEFLSSYAVSPKVAYICHGHDNMAQLHPASWRTITSRQAVTNFVERQRLVSKKYRHVPTAFVANSADTLAFYRNALPRRLASNVLMIPPGFNYTRFASERAAPTEPISDRKLRLVNVASFYPKKNQVFFVEVARELVSQGIDFQIDLLGDGPMRPAVQAAVDDAKLGEQIRLHGNVDDVENWMRRSDIYVHAATYEPFGLVFLEAMAAGLPSVALDGVGNRDLIHNGRNGFLVDSPSAPNFVQRISELASNPPLYSDLSMAARQFAKRYDIESVADRILDLYRSRVAFAHGCGKSRAVPRG